MYGFLMKSEKPSYTLITGASSGIGQGFAHYLASRGTPLILVARRVSRLEGIRDRYRGKCEIEVLPLDLGEPDAAALLSATCAEKGWRVDTLINNAGLGFQDEFCRMTRGEVLSMLRVNIESLTLLAYDYGKTMAHRGGGKILNIASTAGFQAVPLFSVYAATKAYVISLTEGLHEEFDRKGVLVTCLCPGPVATEFQEKSRVSPRFFAASQSVEEVVREGIAALDGNRAVRWSSWFQWWGTFFSWLAPRTFKRKLAYRLLSK